MLQYKAISCVRWLGFSITFYQFFWSLSPPSLEAKNAEICQPLKEGEVKPGLVCKCGEDPFHSLSYVTKRYSYNMTCIDCPPGHFYDFEVFDCRPCPQPNHNCFKHNHTRRDCIPCDAIEPLLSPSIQATTAETPTTSLPTGNAAITTSHVPSTTSPQAPKSIEAATKATAEDTRDSNYNADIAFGLIGAWSFLVAIFGLVVCWCKRNCSEDPRNGVVLQLLEMQ